MNTENGMLSRGDKATMISGLSSPERWLNFRTYHEEKVFTVLGVDGGMIKLSGIPPVPIHLVKKIELKYEDAAGRKLAVGDKVAYIKPGRRELQIGTIAKLSDKQASVYEKNDREYTLGRYYNAIIKIV